jgi:phospholipase C
VTFHAFFLVHLTACRLRTQRHTQFTRRNDMLCHRYTVAAAIAATCAASPMLLAEYGGSPTTRTPIKHLIVLFDENRSFDHYFGTYPVALNLPGERPFRARPDTPRVNGFTEDLLLRNPNKYNPLRLSPSEVAQCSQTHDYTKEQLAANLGAMDKFVENNRAPGPQAGFLSCPEQIVMSYFDGNTVTALWNYAQRYAMSDDHFASNWGSSAVGAINLVSGQTHGASVDKLPDTIAGTVIGNPRPQLDVCSPLTTTLIRMSGRNIGDLLNEKGITWGWFNGGFRTADGLAACTASHLGSNGLPQVDYIPHHAPFQYYPSTANPSHVGPSSLEAIGRTDAANHQYDLDLDFWPAAESGNLPAVSFIKGAAYEEGHNRYSDPLAEQRFLVTTINRLQRLPEWREMAILIVYDDSDGLYDHVLPPLASPSNTAADALTGPGACGTSDPLLTYQGRCGYGPRLPLLLISPYAKSNFVDHALTDQSSVIRFIEDNWRLPRIGDQSLDLRAGSIGNMFDFSHNGKRRHLFLDPETGQPLDGDNID